MYPVYHWSQRYFGVGQVTLLRLLRRLSKDLANQETPCLYLFSEPERNRYLLHPAHPSNPKMVLSTHPPSPTYCVYNVHYYYTVCGRLLSCVLTFETPTTYPQIVMLPLGSVPKSRLDILLYYFPLLPT